MATGLKFLIRPMIHLPHLITDLALILASAGVTMLIFKKLKQPVVLGYLIAGLLVGPNFTLFPTISEIDSIKIWAEIGVIFLLFSLGLEFSFKKLVKVGGSASITAIVEVISMLGIGYLTGILLGWNQMDSIFLGGILSISSTTIIIRAFEELGVKSHKFATVVFGVLIVEDLVAILLLVLLSTLAASQQFAGDEMLMSGLKLTFFLALWFLGGIFLIPTFLKKAKKLMNDEMLLVVSLALCLLMVLLATAAGFSPALGAFVMGAILAETTAAEKIEHLVKPVKDLFGAVFFVSVGMLIDPKILVDYWFPVLIITVVTIFGKTLSSGLGALLSGQTLKHSLQAGMSLAQIGEFSFIIATLGLSLKVTSDFLYPIAVAVSAITTFTTPYFIKLAEPTYLGINKLLPEKARNALARYSAGSQSISGTNNWKEFLKKYIFIIVTNSIIIIGILFSVKYLTPKINNDFVNGNYGDIIIIVVALLLMSPFLWALAVKKIHSTAYKQLWIDTKYNRGPLITLEIVRALLAIIFIVLLIGQFFSPIVSIISAVIIIGISAIIFSSRLQSFYSKIESRFLANLNAREISEAAKRADELMPWDSHLAYYTVKPESDAVGKTLIELSLREHFGVNVALIERGKIKLKIPGKDERLYPGDRIAVIGTDDQLKNFEEFIEATSYKETDANGQSVSLHPITINAHSPLLGKSIKASGIRENAFSLVVGVERNNERILNPDSSFTFEKDDIVWIVGDKKTVQSVIKGEPS
ncbi:cation:proton antiporter domain-containing protein [Solitalea canadensis]|uniref:Kef-type K+ transport system, membrane component n=1 Tax=Solitalea canadensis (strain ATCC 29591 / DSM 3403 / JCM 21819 / LMG 8368 / NBRC 15130 / NCIMB 12057 / USAM 9D) TaxID=929556 RepID=H8KXR0_SOLCM|nr:cation:proton antiporter [Solitalea canadensis]AFD05475.1 Kef-type K+ transport system, membrane component [Solitalea canadensis DSM 3403]